MGNSSSTASSRPSPIPHRTQQFPSYNSPTSPSSPTSNTVHHSLRTKKKSLELPDLALHNNQSSSSHLPPYRRPPPPSAAPIPIPGSANSNTPTSRPQNLFPSTQALDDESIDPPSTHIPIPPFHRQQTSNNNQPSRGRTQRTNRSSANRVRSSRQMSDNGASSFVQETVYSTIPLALSKVEQDIDKLNGDDDDLPIDSSSTRKMSSGDDPSQPAPVEVTWKGGGKIVYVAMASDDNWKGRRPMQREGNSDTWTTTLHLPPGTHHIKFMVDDQWRVATDLPTAVDDDGSLANYVAVPLSTTSTPPTTSPSPQPTPKHVKPGQSFWSNSSYGNGSVSEPMSGSGRREAQWTSTFPPELIAAAKEEEIYLASTSASPHHGVPTPNIPPAPGLPRHLDKLILNQRTGSGSGSSSPSGRSRDREERRSGRKGRSSLGMTRATSPPVSDRRLSAAVSSGTDISRGSRLEVSSGPGLADDTSVLPIPSHVVLQHLSTSAIRNGVLAVGNTTRYKEKYLTTIYYKPT